MLVRVIVRNCISSIMDGNRMAVVKQDFTKSIVLEIVLILTKVRLYITKVKKKRIQAQFRYIFNIK